MREGFLWALLVVGAGACSSPSSGSGTASDGTTVVFDFAADLHSPDTFFDFPFPSDLRLTPSGAPDVAGLPNPTLSAVLEGLRVIAGDRRGFPFMPVAWFRFTAPMASQDVSKTITADKSSTILLVDVDEASPTRGALVPTVASTLNTDRYVPENVLAVAPRPGFILEPHRKYAFVVMRSLGDANGKPLGVAASLDGLKPGKTPAAGTNAAASALYASLWPALDKAGVATADVAAATVFTTGDVVADTYDLSSKILAKYKIDLTGIKVDPDDGATHPRYCELQATVTYPQFQRGVPPFDTEGSIQIGSDGLPIKTRDEVAAVTISLPKQTMPAGGFPLVVYFHGTGGVSDAIADRGVWRPEPDATKCPSGGYPMPERDTWNGVLGCNTKGEGPAHVNAEHGTAMVASALPVNPQRYPEGLTKDLPEYFNINNVASLRDIFRQGIFEQRLLIEALRTLTIDPSVVAACTGLALPTGETAFHFKSDAVMAQGQSMGAMYANLISAVEPRIKATVATGAGGYWTYFILTSQFIPMLPGKLALLLGIRGEYTFMHPALQLAQIGLEPADPMAYMPRVAHSPLPMHPVRPVFQPVGKGDSYFTTVVQDQVALAYRNQEAGTQVWPTMQDGLGLVGLGGIAPYPVAQNRTSASGAAYTGVVVQYEGDGLYDPHAIYSQLDAVKYQYGCFFETFAKTGTATIPAPAAFGTPCPTK